MTEDESRVQQLFLNNNTVWLPPPDLKISQWADRFRRIPPEASAEPGQWRTSRAEYQREIMDAISDPLIERVVVMTAAQVGKTEILLNVIGYFIDQDPSPILVFNPKKNLSVNVKSLDGEDLGELTAMVYIMTSKAVNARFANSVPSDYYYSVLDKGYKTFGFDKKILEGALIEAYKHFNSDFGS